MGRGSASGSGFGSGGCTRSCRRSSRVACVAAPFPNRRSMRSSVRSTSPHRSPRSNASCSAPAGLQPRRLDAQQADPPAGAGQPPVELGDHVVQVGADVGGVRQRARPRQRREVREPHLQRDGPRPIAVVAQTCRHAARQVQQLAQDLVHVVEVTFERLLVADRLRCFVGDHGAVVARRGRARQVRAAASPRSRSSTAAASARGRRRCGSPSGPRARPSSLRPPTAARPAADRGTRSVSSAGTCSSAVGLAVVRRELRDELRRGHPGRARDADLALDVRADLLGDPRPARRTAWWRRRTSRNASSSEIGSTSGVCASRTSRNRFECSAVGLEVRRQEHRVGAQAPRAHGWHRRANAERGVPRRRRSTTTPRAARAADDDGFATQGGILQHLDPGVERVEIDMQDRLGWPRRHLLHPSRSFASGLPLGVARSHPALVTVNPRSRDSRATDRRPGVRRGGLGRVPSSPRAGCRHAEPAATPARSHTSSAITLTPCFPVRRSCPQPPSRRRGRPCARPCAAPRGRP